MRFTIENGNIKGYLGFGEIQISPSEKNGYRPYELFVSPLCGCSGTLLGNILLKKRNPYQRIEMEVYSVRNPEHANRIEQISITAYVQSEKYITGQQAEKIANLVVNNCGMIQSVIKSIDITFMIKSLPLDRDRH